MIFGASEDVSLLPTVADQRELTRLMQRAWFAFAEDPAHGLEEVLGWPQFDPAKKTLIELGLGNSPNAEFTYPSTYDALCSNVVMGALGVAALL
jgi:carboxylesterase type B